MSEPVILTADDPEPPEGSVVLTQAGDAWQLSNGFWWCRKAYTDTWHDMCANAPLTLIHRGPDPEPPATWRAGFGTPPDGTIVADDHLAPWILEDGIWRCATPHRVVTTKLSGLTRRCTVLRWGWGK